MRYHSHAIDLFHQVVADDAHLVTCQKLHHALMSSRKHLEAYHLTVLSPTLACQVFDVKRLLPLVLGILGGIVARHPDARLPVRPLPLLAMVSEFGP